MAAKGESAIVNTASVAGLGALMRPVDYAENRAILEGFSSYVASKYEIVGLTK